MMLFHPCVHWLQVTGGVMMLCNFLDIAGIRDDVASMLQDKILAILVHFDQRLNNATISLSEKIKVRAVRVVGINVSGKKVSGQKVRFKNLVGLAIS